MKNPDTYCQIFENDYKNPKCKEQCDFCKKSIINLKLVKKAKNRVKRKRYYLHGVIKKQGYKFNARKKVVYIPSHKLEFSPQVNKLQTIFGYSLQYEIT